MGTRRKLQRRYTKNFRWIRVGVFKLADGNQVAERKKERKKEKNKIKNKIKLMFIA